MGANRAGGSCVCSSVESGSSNLAIVIGMVWTCTKTMATKLLRGLLLACGVLLLCGTCVFVDGALHVGNSVRGALDALQAVAGVIK